MAVLCGSVSPAFLFRKAESAFLDPTVENTKVHRDRCNEYQNILKYFEIGATTNPDHPIGKADPTFLRRKAADTYPKHT